MFVEDTRLSDTWTRAPFRSSILRIWNGVYIRRYYHGCLEIFPCFNTIPPGSNHTESPIYSPRWIFRVFSENNVSPFYLHF